MTVYGFFVDPYRAKDCQHIDGTWHLQLHAKIERA
jgi:hypothetical protein